jgi:DNA-binding response OmpR family regulator
VTQTLVLGIVEDDESVIQYLKAAFERDRITNPEIIFQLMIAGDGASVSEWINSDVVDVWIVDLNLPANKSSTQISWHVGRDLIRQIHSSCTGAIIVYTSESLGELANELLAIGADDFIRKAEVSAEFSGANDGMGTYIRTKLLSVWRRAKTSRPRQKSLSLHSHRVFRVGEWRFEVASRMLSSNDTVIRLTANEHAVLRHMCVSESHSINRDEFLAFVAGEKNENEDVRLKNLVYRLRQKLGSSVVISNYLEGYVLNTISELRQ